MSTATAVRRKLKLTSLQQSRGHSFSARVNVREIRTRAQIIGSKGVLIKRLAKQHGCFLHFNKHACMIKSKTMPDAILVGRTILKKATTIQNVGAVDYPTLYHHITGKMHESASVRDIIDAYDAKPKREEDKKMNLADVDFEIYALNHALNYIQQVEPVCNGHADECASSGQRDSSP